MDQLIAFLKLVGALASFATGIIRLLSAASEFSNRSEKDR